MFILTQQRQKYLYKGKDIKLFLCLIKHHVMVTVLTGI
jgi:hypothetical protein